MTKSPKRPLELFAVEVEVHPSNKRDQPSCVVLGSEKEAYDLFDQLTEDQCDGTTVSLKTFELGQDLVSDAQVLHHKVAPYVKPVAKKKTSAKKRTNARSKKKQKKEEYAGGGTWHPPGMKPGGRYW